MNRRFVLGAVVLIVAACGGSTAAPSTVPTSTDPVPSNTPASTAPESSLTAASPSSPSAGLVAKDAPGRYRISVPADWQVSQDSNGRVIAGDGSTQLTVWPFFTTVASFGTSNAAAAMDRWLPAVAPGVTFTSAVPTTSGIIARGSSADGDALALVDWQSLSQGTSGVAAVVVSPHLADLTGTIADVLGSFVPEGAPDSGGAAAPSVSFTAWTDPSEGAFSADMPTGWTIDGKVVRRSLLIQSYMTAASPDGAIRIYMGDAFGYYVEPTSTLAYAGLGEGDTYTATDGSTWPIMRYHPGASFLADVLLPSTGQNIVVTKTTNRPDIAAAIPTIGINRFAAGEVDYTVGDRVGHGMVVTEEVTMGISAAWDPWRVILVTAPPAQMAEASAVVTRMASSFKIDPQWATSQAKATAAQSKIMADQNAAVSGIISDGYWGRQATSDAISVRRERANLDVVDLTDGSGNAYRVDAGSDYYWIGSDGSVVGTTTSAAPAADYRALLELP